MTTRDIWIGDIKVPAGSIFEMGKKSVAVLGALDMIRMGHVPEAQLKLVKPDEKKEAKLDWKALLSIFEKNIER